MSDEVLVKGPNRSSKVILTYDDCPKSLDSFKKAIDAAAAEHITVAVAAIGPCQSGPTFDANYARSKGQVVIGHSVHHKQLTKLTDEQIRAEIDPATRASGVMRPPYGDINMRVRKVLAAEGIRAWNWTVDTRDWDDKPQVEVVKYVIETAKPGDTVLMHMPWNAFNPEAIRQIKAGLTKRNVGLCQAYVGQTSPVKLPERLPC